MSAFILLPISLLLLLLLLLKCSCGFTAKASSVVGSCLRSAQHAAEAAESCRRQTIFPDSPFFLHHHQISPKIVQRKKPIWRSVENVSTNSPQQQSDVHCLCQLFYDSFKISPTCRKIQFSHSNKLEGIYMSLIKWTECNNFPHLFLHHTLPICFRTFTFTFSLSLPILNPVSLIPA